MIARIFLPFAAIFALMISLGAKPAVPPPKPLVPSGPQYFFNINLDPRYQIVGTGPLTSAQAATANSYCFTYGADGKIQRIEFDRAGTPMDDPFFRTARIDFEYAPGIERRWYRDGNDKAVPNFYGVYGEELTLDRTGYPTAVANLNASGGTVRDSAGIVRIDRSLDAQSRLVRSRRTGLLGIFITDTNGLFETRTIYDSQSRPIERDNYDASGKQLNDGDGVASVHTAYAAMPDGNQVTETYFDADGQPIENKSSGVHGQQVLSDPRGFQLSISYFDGTNQPDVDAVSGVHERRMVYDDRGNKMSEEFFGTDDRPANDRTLGFARLDFRYDDKNRIVEKRYVGDDGLPQIPPNVGAAMIRQEYDAQGNIVRRQFFDGQGAPSNNAVYGVPAIRIKVEGGITTVSLRDEHDRPARNPDGGFSSFSYRSTQDHPLSRHNLFYDLHGHRLTAFSVFVIHPHIHELRQHTGMRRRAHWGIVAAILGALTAMALAIRKTSFTKRRRVYVPSAFERFLGWFAVFTLVEGTICFSHHYLLGVGQLPERQHELVRLGYQRRHHFIFRLSPSPHAPDHARAQHQPRRDGQISSRFLRQSATQA